MPVKKEIEIFVDMVRPGIERQALLELRHNDENHLTIITGRNGQEVTMTELGATTVNLAVKRSDGLVVVLTGSIVGDRAVFILDGNSLAKKGKTEATAQYFDAEMNRISTATFEFKALEDPTAGDYEFQVHEQTIVDAVLNAPDVIQQAIDATEAAEAKTLELETVVTENTITWLNEPVQTMAELPAASTNLGVAAVVLEPDAQGRYKTVRSDGTTWQTIEAFTPTQYSAISAQLDDKATKGEIKGSDLSIANDADKINEVNLSDALKLKITGNAPIHTTPTPLSTDNTKLATGAVSLVKTDFATTGKNLIDDSTFVDNKLLSASTGATVDNTAYKTSDFEEITPSTILTQNKSGVLAFYDINKVFISGLAQISPYSSRTFETPSNAFWFKTSVYKADAPVGTYQIEKGSVATSYEQKKVVIKGLAVEREDVGESLKAELDSYSANEGRVTELEGNFDRLAEFDPVYINESATGTSGTNQSNTSTFSGWGSPVGVRQDFDTISFHVNQWDATKPITKIRLIVKENNYSGVILADKTFDVSVPQGQLEKLDLQFDEVIVNSGAVPLWVEFHTNGRTGHVLSTPFTYAPPTYPPVKFSTQASVTVLTMSDTGGTYNIYFEFKKFDGTKVVPSQELAESLGAPTKTDHYGKFLLRNWQSQASKYVNPEFNERIELMIIGDSWVQGKYRLTEPLRNKLKAIYGDGGIGFIGFANSHYGNGPIVLTLGGTWTQYDAPTGNGQAKGIDTAHAESSTAGSTVSLNILESNTYLRVLHIQQTGSYQYRVDGGSWTIVDCSTSDNVVISGLTSANHLFEFEVLSGTVAFVGAYSYRDTKGSVVHKVGNGGQKASDIVQTNEENWIYQMSKSNVHAVGILLGTNDMSANVSLSLFKSQITSVINRIKSALPLSDVFLIAPSGNNLTGRLHTMQEYSDALLDVSKTEKVGFISLYENIGDYEEANARGLYEDGVHPNSNGGYVNTNVLYDRLLRVG